MPDDNDITVVMTTYAPDGPGRVRATYASRCVEYLLAYLRYSGGKLKLHIADDGSPDPGYCLHLIQQADKDPRWIPGSFSSSYRRGVGASINAALALLDTKYWMYTTDDWLLKDILNLDQAIKLLNFGYDVVRVGPIHPELRCITEFNVDIGWWLWLQVGYGFAFATRPFVATKNFTSTFGHFPEGKNAYDTERIYSESLTQTRPMIAYSDVFLRGPWYHIGDYEVGTLEDFNYGS